MSRSRLGFWRDNLAYCDRKCLNQKDSSRVFESLRTQQKSYLKEPCEPDTELSIENSMNSIRRNSVCLFPLQMSCIFFSGHFICGLAEEFSCCIKHCVLKFPKPVNLLSLGCIAWSFPSRIFLFVIARKCKNCSLVDAGFSVQVENKERCNN